MTENPPVEIMTKTADKKGISDKKSKTLAARAAWKELYRINQCNIAGKNRY